MKNKAETFIIDFVAKGTSPGEWKIVLVEQGPWSGPVVNELMRIQERLYESLEAVLEGRLAERFPETKGASIIIQLDCYNVPDVEVREFFSRFSAGVLQLPDFLNALRMSVFAKGISFELNMETIN